MMKKYLLLTTLFFASIHIGQALDASISYATYKGVEQNYVEVYLHVVGETVRFVPLEGDSILHHSSVEVLMIFTRNEKVAAYEKYQLNSPSSPFPLNFIDLQRFALKNGRYDLEVTITDVNDPENTTTYNTNFRIYFSEEKVEQSDIQLLTSFKKAPDGATDKMVKNGLYLECLPFNFYPKNAPVLLFYNEIYGTDKHIGEDYMVSYAIETVKSDENPRRETVLIGHKRRTPAPVDVLLIQVDISELQSGNYNLLVEVRDKTKALISKKKVFFQRSNPYLNLDNEPVVQSALDEEFVASLTEQDLRYGLKAIAPLVAETDGELINRLVKEKDPKAMRLYLFSFWVGKHPNRPDVAYAEYMKVARHADNMFKSGFGYGFETDRGYVFMKYGAPSDVVTVEDDPVAPPYEIWSYNDFPYTGQTNVKFIFYNPSLVGGGFVQLHSTARGEFNNPRWEVDLYGNSPNEMDGGDYFQGGSMQDNMGRRARRLFNDF